MERPIDKIRESTLRKAKERVENPKFEEIIRKEAHEELKRNLNISSR